MASINAVLTAENGDDLYPETYDDYVLDSNGEALSTRLGDRSEAGGVSGTSAFEKINTLSSDLTNMMTYSNISAGATKTLPGGSYLMLFSRAGTNYGMFATFRDWGLIVPVVQGTAGMTLSISNDEIVIANTSVGATVGMIAIKIT